MNQIDALAVAILKAVDVPWENASGIVFRHSVGSLPTLDVTFNAWDADTNQLSETHIRFVPEVGE